MRPKLTHETNVLIATWFLPAGPTRYTRIWAAFSDAASRCTGPDLIYPLLTFRAAAAKEVNWELLTALLAPTAPPAARVLALPAAASLLALMPEVGDAGHLHQVCLNIYRIEQRLAVL